MDLVARFLDHLRDERGLSPRTRSAYARDLALFNGMRILGPRRAMLLMSLAPVISPVTRTR